ncbi:MAG: type II toxin-antitoxin system Phd/YefM family antitoxin [Gemmatimonadetes bacterium]|nr:type II toxin-antitoxin system Phd/YefM family antitoxin [Gemmatimonadota bacterium]
MSGKRPAPATPRHPREARTIQASTFKATCLDLMDEVAASGVELIVTKHGRPVVKVGPVDEVAPASPFGFLGGTVVGHGDIVAPDHESWRVSPADPLVRRR